MTPQTPTTPKTPTQAPLPTTPATTEPAVKDAEVAKKELPAPTTPTPQQDPAPKHKVDLDTKYLSFTPRAWAKVSYLRDRGGSEVSGMGISSTDDPFLIIDFRLIKQYSCSTFTEFDDTALANFVEDMVIDEKIPPQRCMRVWIHTHPNMSPSPSGHDESTFKRVNAQSSWGLMCVIANDKEYARLCVNNAEGMRGQRELKVRVELFEPFAGVTAEDYAAWEQEYCKNVTIGFRAAKTGVVIGESANYRDFGDQESGWWGSPGGSELVALNHWKELELDFTQYSPQQIQMMKREVDGHFYVFTNSLWMQYGDESEVHAQVGEHIDDLRKISHIDPIEWGDVEWGSTGPWLLTAYGEDHYLNDEFDDLRYELEVEEELKDERELEDDDDDGAVNDTGS